MADLSASNETPPGLTCFQLKLFFFFDVDWRGLSSLVCWAFSALCLLNEALGVFRAPDPLQTAGMMAQRVKVKPDSEASYEHDLERVRNKRKMQIRHSYSIGSIVPVSWKAFKTTGGPNSSRILGVTSAFPFRESLCSVGNIQGCDPQCRRHVVHPCSTLVWCFYTFLQWQKPQQLDSDNFTNIKDTNSCEGSATSL